MLRLLFDFLGLILIGLGIILSPTPIPIGLLLIALGVLLLAANEVLVQKEIRKQRGKHPHFDTLLKNLSKRLPTFLGDIVKKTEP